ncbi:hypothetical protein BDW71DRAFT_85474 [Aspergillus fruticulosus]
MLVSDFRQDRQVNKYLSIGNPRRKQDCVLFRRKVEEIVYARADMNLVWQAPIVRIRPHDINSSNHRFINEIYPSENRKHNKPVHQVMGSGVAAQAAFSIPNHDATKSVATQWPSSSRGRRLKIWSLPFTTLQSGSVIRYYAQRGGSHSMSVRRIASLQQILSRGTV